MRQTPRHLRSPRGIGTLIGNGWLHQAPSAPKRADLPRGHAALRNCLLMEVPEEIRRLALAARAVSVLPPPAPRPFVASKDVATHRRNPANDVRMFPAVPQSALRATPLMAPSAPARAWWEDPVALGSLLILAPPIGLAALWSSHRYSSDARWALTIMTALTMCLSTAIAIAALVKR